MTAFFLLFYYNTHSVADVNQSLIDDGLVDKEKISGTNYFWSFPAKKDRQKQLEHEATLQEIEKLKSSIVGTRAALMDAKRGREEEEEIVVPQDEEGEPVPKEAAASDGGEAKHEGDDGKEEDAPPAAKKIKKSTNRAAMLERLAIIAKEVAAGEAEAAVLKQNDPQALADLEKELQLTTQAAHRWTDNIFNGKAYLVKKRGMDKKEACKVLGITSAFDCESSGGLFCVCFVTIFVKAVCVDFLLPRNSRSCATHLTQIVCFSIVQTLRTRNREILETPVHFYCLFDGLMD